MGKPSATDEEVYQAARDCGCYDFILNLEMDSIQLSEVQEVTCRAVSARELRLPALY